MSPSYIRSTSKRLDNIQKDIEGHPLMKFKGMKVEDVYKQMDTSFDGFFLKRKYDVKNFNFLLQILAEQKNYKEALAIFQRMKEMNINPNAATYNQMIKVCAKTRNVSEAEQFLEEAKTKKLSNSLMFTSLLNVYAREGNIQQCELIFKEMKEIGFKIDVAVYTTLINGFFKGRNINKCWKIYNSMGVKPDEHLLSLMIEICGKTKDCEKALHMIKELEEMGIKGIAPQYNSIIKALGSRDDYAERAIQFFEQMQNSGIVPDDDTFIAVLNACSRTGDIKTAFNTLEVMKYYDIKPTKYTYCAILQVYAGFMEQEFMEEDKKEIVIQDVWRVFELAKEQEALNTAVLNNLLLVHTNNMMEAEVEGVILPMYNQLGIPQNEYTHQFTLQMYLNKRDLNTFYRVFDISLAKVKEHTWWSWNFYLEASIRGLDLEKIIFALNKFLEMKREPRPLLLQKLGEAKNIPEILWVTLNRFKTKFGYVKNPKTLEESYKHDFSGKAFEI